MSDTKPTKRKTAACSISKKNASNGSWIDLLPLDGEGVIELSLTVIEEFSRDKKGNRSMEMDRFLVGSSSAAGGLTEKHAKQRVFLLNTTGKGGTFFYVTAQSMAIGLDE